MIIDIDRLHKVALGEITGRGVGKTTLACNDVAAAVELGSSNVIFCLVETKRSTFSIYPLLNNVFCFHELPLTRRSDMEFVSGNVSISFRIIPKRDEDVLMCGIRGTVVDFRD
jgi:hypothetical protein